MTFSPTLVFQAFYVFCVSYALVSDVLYLKIPNWVSGLLFVVFFLYFATFGSNIDLLGHLKITFIIFIMSFVFYYLKWLGGGDVKLLTALSLWMGPVNIFAFILLMSVFGSLLALLIQNLGWFLNVNSTVAKLVPAIVQRWAKEGVCPYGIAIGVAGLIMGTQIFAT